MSALCKGDIPQRVQLRVCFVAKGRKPLVYAYTPLNTTRSEYTAENLDREKKLVQRDYLRFFAPRQRHLVAFS